MPDEEKSKYIEEAKRLQQEHSQKHPDYKYKPRRRKQKQLIKKSTYSFPYTGAENAVHAAAAMKLSYAPTMAPDAIHYQQYYQMPQHAPYPTMYDMAAVHAQRPTHGFSAPPSHANSVHELPYTAVRPGEMMVPTPTGPHGHPSHIYSTSMDSGPTTSGVSAFTNAAQNIHAQQITEASPQYPPQLYTQRHV